MMDAPLRFTMVGTGAVGCFYGARLSAGGASLRFIARGDFATLRREGLLVESPLGDWRHPVEVHDLNTAPPRADVLCIAVKSTANAGLIEPLRSLMASARGAGTLILNLQNGLTFDEELATAFPEAVIVAGLCFLCSNRVGAGHVRHLDYGKVTFAPLDARARPWIEPLMRAFAAGGIEVEATDSLPAARWRKLAWNIPFNGLSALLEANTDRMIADPDTRLLVLDLMDEVAAGAAACGCPFIPGFLQGLMAMTECMHPYATSMRLDAMARRPMELEYIYRRPLREARRRGVVMPVTTTVARQLGFLDRHPHPR